MLIFTCNEYEITGENQIKHYYRYCRKLDETNLNIVKQQLNSINWDCVLQTDNTNEAYDKFHAIFMNF